MQLSSQLQISVKSYVWQIPSAFLLFEVLDLALQTSRGFQIQNQLLEILPCGWVAWSFVRL